MGPSSSGSWRLLCDSAEEFASSEVSRSAGGVGCCAGGEKELSELDSGSSGSRPGSLRAGGCRDSSGGQVVRPAAWPSCSAGGESRRASSLGVGIVRPDERRGLRQGQTGKHGTRACASMDDG
jgi:hypothetical protein